MELNPIYRISAFAKDFIQRAVAYIHTSIRSNCFSAVTTSATGLRHSQDQLQSNAPYVITKPLHHTQKLLTDENGGKVFSIKVILNFELERELLGFGSKIKVLSPRILVKQMKENLAKSLERYETI